MLRWAAAHWPGAPAYLTLLGDGHWNMKGIAPELTAQRRITCRLIWRLWIRGLARLPRMCAMATLTVMACRMSP